MRSPRFSVAQAFGAASRSLPGGRFHLKRQSRPGGEGYSVTSRRSLEHFPSDAIRDLSQETTLSLRDRRRAPCAPPRAATSRPAPDGEADGTSGPHRASITDVPVSVVWRSRRSGSGVVGRERDDAVDPSSGALLHGGGPPHAGPGPGSPLPRPPHQRWTTTIGQGGRGYGPRATHPGWEAQRRRWWTPTSTQPPLPCSTETATAASRRRSSRNSWAPWGWPLPTRPRPGPSR